MKSAYSWLEPKVHTGSQRRPHVRNAICLQMPPMPLMPHMAVNDGPRMMMKTRQIIFEVIRLNSRAAKTSLKCPCVTLKQQLGLFMYSEWSTG
jgi:hypothetical protein